MKSYNNVYVGTLDILGFDNLENYLRRYDNQTSDALLEKLFNFLDERTSTLLSNDNIHCHRYGDGYVFFSLEDNVEHLEEMIKSCCQLLAFSFSQTFPIRIAITQSDLNVDKNIDGLTISGKGWEVLRKIEKALNWMGGFLYIPSYDGTHHDKIQDLIHTTHLIKEQNTHENINFQAPFKENHGLIANNTWFLNWYKVFRTDKNQTDALIKNWWTQLGIGSNLNNHEEVEKKQQNTIQFADYCRELLNASKLIYFSDVNRDIKIDQIM